MMNDNPTCSISEHLAEASDVRPRTEERLRQHNTNSNPPFHIVHCNTQRSATKHRLLLDLAFRNNIDCICVQEPWVNKKLDEKKTQSHQAYTTISPTKTWEFRPRVITYVRKHIDISQELLRGREHPDICRTSLKLPTAQKISITNLYNARENSERPNEALNILQQTPCNRRHIVCGDFNIHHPVWDSRTQTNDPRAEEFITWADQQNLHLLSDREIPTRHYAVLDLSFASNDLVQGMNIRADIDCDVDCNSDHRPVRITLEGGNKSQGRKEQGTYKFERMAKDKFDEVCQREIAAIRWTWDVPRADKEATLRSLVLRVQDALKTALDASTPRSSGRGTGKPYWTEECTEAARRHREACRWWKACHGVPFVEEEARLERNKTGRFLEKALRGAKSTYYRDRIASMTEAKDIFRMVRSTKSPQQFVTPALSPEDGPPVTSTEEKIETLMRTHVVRSSSTDLPHKPVLPREEARREWPPITSEEAQAAIFKPRNTSPGIDGLQNIVLKLGWESIKGLVTVIFNMSLEWGCVPTEFKRTRLCAVPKGGKRDKSNPRSYRLIALLPTLAKGLERIIARRLAFEAVEQTIIPPNYLSAVPKRATTDLLLHLTDELECQVNRQKRIGTMMTYDIKGAFDSVGPNRMVQRLIEQRWPVKVCRWVQAFLKDRQADMTLDGQIGGVRTIGGALPQGSPISSILFQLFMSPLYHLSPRRRGYADDGVITVYSDNFVQNILQAKQELIAVHRWCQQNGLELDLGKSEVMHFTRRQTRENPGITLPNGEVLQANSPDKTIRWLGVHFDRKLTFNQHIKMASSRATRVVDGFKLLTGCYKGAPVSTLLNAIRSAVLPVLTYGYQAWWRAANQTRNKGLITQMDTAVRRAIRAALPVYCTTPNCLLNHAAGFPPIELILDDLLIAEAVRLSTLDPQHILRNGSPNGRIQWIRQKLLPRPIPAAEYLRRYYRQPASSRPVLARDEQKQQHESIRREASKDDVWAYSDGSRNERGATGAGWVVYHGDTPIKEEGKYCGIFQEVIDAEAIAACEAVIAATRYRRNATSPTGKLWICLDNQSVCTRLQKRLNDACGSSQREIDLTLKMIERWNGKVEVLWTPGHLDIPGNERADALAKQATDEKRFLHHIYATAEQILDPRNFVEDLMSKASARRWRQTQLKTSFADWWRTHANQGRMAQLKLETPLPWQGKIYKGLERKDVGRVLAARSHHGDFAQYHERFQHENARLECPCGARKSPTHPWTCTGRSRRWRERFILQLLRTCSGLKKLTKMLHQT